MSYSPSPSSQFFILIKLNVLWVETFFLTFTFRYRKLRQDKVIYKDH